MASPGTSGCSDQNPVRPRGLQREGSRMRQDVYLAAGPRAAAATLDPIMVKSHRRIVLVKPDEVDWIEAQGDYVCLHAGETRHLLRSGITGLLRQLPPESFLRIHRSAAVNLDRVKTCRGHGTLVLQDGTRLTVSRSYRAFVAGRLKPTT